MFGIAGLIVILGVLVLLRKIFRNKIKLPLMTLFLRLLSVQLSFLVGGIGNYALAKNVTVSKSYNFHQLLIAPVLAMRLKPQAFILEKFGKGDNLWICAKGNINITHRVRRDNSNDTLSVNDVINFTYEPDDPFYYATSGSSDSPYGKWCSSLSGLNCRNSTYETIVFIGEKDQSYIEMTWLAIKPDVYMTSNDPSVYCDGMTCTAIEKGSATITAHIDNVTARPWLLGFQKLVKFRVRGKIRYEKSQAFR